MHIMMMLLRINVYVHRFAKYKGKVLTFSTYSTGLQNIQERARERLAGIIKHVLQKRSRITLYTTFRLGKKNNNSIQMDH